jgi:alpha/beta superfamily hydrolase
VKWDSAGAGMAVIPAGACGYAGERIVRIDNGGRGLVGILNMPDGVATPPAVLMLHGFTGQKNELPIAKRGIGLFSYTAAKLAEKGIATLRIDFHGSGESAGRWEDTTFSGQIGDATLALDYLRALPDIDGTRVGVLGYSQGGLVGSHLAALRPETCAVVLWAPVTNPMSTYSYLLGADTVATAIAGEASEAITTKLLQGGETTLKGAFYKELPLFVPAGAISKYRGPLRVIVGRRETVVTPQPAAGQSLLNYHAGINDLVEIDSDHDWDAETSPETAENVLIPRTAEWFAEHL